MAGDAGRVARNRVAELFAISARGRPIGGVSGNARFSGGAARHGGARSERALAAGDGAVLRIAGRAPAGRGYAGAPGNISTGVNSARCVVSRLKDQMNDPTILMVMQPPR